MKKILAGVLGGAAVAAAIFGAGPANADNEYAGMTYAKAEETIQSYGATAVIASRVGDYLPTEECLVTRSRRANFLDSSGNSGSKIHLYLNCNDTKTAGHPGYSVATPEGKKAQALRETATSISKDYAAATADGKEPFCADKYYEWCQRQCEAAGSCSAEVLEYLGL